MDDNMKLMGFPVGVGIMIGTVVGAVIGGLLRAANKPES